MNACKLAGNLRRLNVFSNSNAICWARCLASSSGSAPITPKIYTRHGDKGTSSLFTGERRPKNHAVFHALGDVDELSSFLGVSVACPQFSNDSSVSKEKSEKLTTLLERIEEVQCLLQDVAGKIANPPPASSNKKPLKSLPFPAESADMLESWIDEYQEQMPPLKNFILASGGQLATSLHVARSVCRRAERRIVELNAVEPQDQAVLKFMNRLSDFLFSAARFACHLQGCQEKIYHRAKVATPTNKDA